VEEVKGFVRLMLLFLRSVWLIKVRPDSSVLEGNKLSGRRSESRQNVLIKHLSQIVRPKANKDGEKKKREL
jgi:hypothetical protein